MPGVFAHCGSILETACQARDRAASVVRAGSTVFTSDAIVSIVLAAAATEAFINELTECVALQRDAAYRQTNPISPALRSFADTLEEIEESRGNLALKYLMASQTLSGRTFDKGSNPYQDFATLITLRNDLMHVRPRDTFVEPTAGGLGSVHPPKYIKGLQQRGLALKPPEHPSVSWFDLLRSAQMASWACSTAHNIILAVLNFIPDGPSQAWDPSFEFKGVFRQRQPWSE